MGLLTDKMFFAALQADDTFMQAINGRLYETIIPVPDKDLDNVPLPYCIVSFDGLNNSETTKDDPYEGDYDQVQIGIELAAKTREELGQLAKMVRRIIHTEFAWCHRYEELHDRDDAALETTDEFRLMVIRNYEQVINDVPVYYTFSTDKVYGNPDRPCRMTFLNYLCEVKRPDDDEQEDE